MKIMKFGGGCLKDGESFVRAAGIIAAEDKPCTVVVSAANSVTDFLYNGIREAASHGQAVPRLLTEIRRKHEELAGGSVKSAAVHKEILRTLEDKLGRLEKLLMAVSYAGEISPSLEANILSYGERLSAIVFAGALRSCGIPSAAWDSDAIGMVTEEACENAPVDLEKSRENVSSSVPAMFQQNAVPVITGFFGRTPEGRVSTFGRNGSDYSAAVVAAVLNASRLEIWKDVDGFLSADPKQVANPVPIPVLSQLEAAELSYFGAKILHPRTFEPLAGKDILVVMKNFLEPKNPGTQIMAHGMETEDVVKSVTSNLRIALLMIHGAGVGFKPGVIGRIGRRLADRGVNIYSVITSQTCINLLVDKADAARSLEEIRGLSNGIIRHAEIRDGIVLIAVVGEGLLRRPGVAARVLSAVSKAGINVEMMSMGASEVAAYIIVSADRASEAVNAIHNDFFERQRNAKRVTPLS